MPLTTKQVHDDRVRLRDKYEFKNDKKKRVQNNDSDVTKKVAKE